MEKTQKKTGEANSKIKCTCMLIIHSAELAP